jgi:surface antigen
MPYILKQILPYYRRAIYISAQPCFRSINFFLNETIAKKMSTSKRSHQDLDEEEEFDEEEEVQTEKKPDTTKSPSATANKKAKTTNTNGEAVFSIGNCHHFVPL